MRTDSPTGSRDSFSLVLSCAAQERWSCGSANAASAYLQGGGIERLLLLMTPKATATTRMRAWSGACGTGSTHGTWDAGRSWCQHFRDRLADKLRVHECFGKWALSL